MDREQLISLSKAKKLKKIGFRQTSEYFWWENMMGETLVTKEKPEKEELKDEEGWAAYSTLELLSFLPKNYKDKRLETHDNRANNIADVICDLIKKGELSL